jgi:hypothetical protein
MGAAWAAEHAPIIKLAAIRLKIKNFFVRIVHLLGFLTCQGIRRKLFYKHYV